MTRPSLEDTPFRGKAPQRAIEASQRLLLAYEQNKLLPKLWPLVILSGITAFAIVIGRILASSYARQDLAGEQVLIGTYSLLLILAPIVTYITLWCIVPRFNFKSHWTFVVGLVMIEEIALLGAIMDRIKYIVG